MARKRGKGLVLAGLAAGAYAYFKNPENREKATIAFNNAKAKVNSYMESQNLENEEKSAKEGSNPSNPRKNKMVSEGSPVQYYNEDEQKEENTKLSPNDASSEKAENTDSASPENKINTQNL